MILAGLLPFLLHYHPNHEEQLLKFFSDPDKERLGEVTWDPVKYCIVTPDDIAVDSLMEGDDEFDLSPSQQDDSSTTLATLGPQAPVRPTATNLEATTLYGTDDNSVSTFAMATTTGTKGSKVTRGRKATNPNTATQKHQASHVSTVSSISVTTDERFMAFESSVKSDIAALTSQMQQFLLQQQSSNTASLRHFGEDPQPNIQDSSAWQPPCW